MFSFSLSLSLSFSLSLSRSLLSQQSLSALQRDFPARLPNTASFTHLSVVVVSLLPVHRQLLFAVLLHTHRRERLDGDAGVLLLATLQ